MAIGDNYPLPPVTTKDHRCDECDEPIELFSVEFYKGEGHYKQVQGGICLDFSGGYEEFGDLAMKFLEEHEPPSGYVVLCHDCTALVYSALPKATAKFGTRLHHPIGQEADKPCCRWSWTLKKVGDEMKLFVPDETAEKWVEAPPETT